MTGGKRCLLTFFLLTLLISQVFSEDAEFCATVCKQISRKYTKLCQTEAFDDKKYYSAVHEVIENKSSLSHEEFQKKFRNALLDSNKNTNIYTYNYVSKVLLRTLIKLDENVGDVMTLYYTGENITKTLERDNIWDVEHVWAKSYGFNSPNKDTDPYWDLHNLRPCNSSVNRGFKKDRYFKEGGESFCILPYNQKDVSKCNVWGKNTCDSIEPPKSYKADSARIIFYMELMYSESYNLSIVDSPNINDKQSAFGSKRDLLIWAKDSTVSTVEKNRNRKIYCIQKNRNPFIDHPDWIDALYEPWLFVPANPTPSQPSIEGSIPGDPLLGPVSMAVVITIASISTLFIAGVVYNTFKGEKGLDRLPLYTYVSKYWSKKSDSINIF